MDPNERKGWEEIVTSEDLDKHMANIGQASVNAEMIKCMFQDYPLKGSRLLIPGCGTGQMFDYIAPTDLGLNLELTLTDINPSFLSQAKKRLRKFTGIDYKLKIDDIEETKLRGNYDGVLIVLVFHHVFWKKSLDSLLTLSPKQIFVIEQEQDVSKPAVTKERVLPETIREYAEIANPKLVLRDELIQYMSDRGYNLRRIYKKQVPDNKTMVGFVFEK